MTRLQDCSSPRLVAVIAVAWPASAARPGPRSYYNPDTNQWEEQQPIAPIGRGHYTPIPRETVPYDGKFKPGTIVVETAERRLYFVLPGGQAIRYGIGVGREGFRWAGQHAITRKAEWPGWTPPVEMRKRVPDLPAYMPGGPDNPLGARALYIGATLYRLHGTVGALDHRPGRFLGLHPPHQRRHHRPLRPREGRLDGRRPPVSVERARSLRGRSFGAGLFVCARLPAILGSR